MHPNLDRMLVTTFPNLYRDRNGRMQDTAMCWGFECGDGWYDLLWEVSHRLEALIVLLPEGERPCAAQVKEKFGTLRLYMTGESPEMRTYIQMAEDRSARTCEDCGKPGRRRSVGWIQTLCWRCCDPEQRRGPVEWALGLLFARDW